MYNVVYKVQYKSASIKLYIIHFIHIIHRCVTSGYCLYTLYLYRYSIIMYNVVYKVQYKSV